jgi:hypothetical protein
MTLHPAQPYIVYNDLPKIDDLKRVLPDLYRADPVLVTARHRTDRRETSRGRGKHFLCVSATHGLA